jgi:signal transduction histidine kinase
MGLAIARTIVEKHGGSIGGRRAGGETVFEFRLPLLESAAPPARPGA